VKYRGVDIGKVSEIKLDPANPEEVRLTFQIERGTPIKADTEAVLKTQGLTGIAYVELSGGSREAPTLVATARGQLPVIRTKPSLSARLENVATRVLASLDKTSESLNSLLSDQNRAALQSTLADLSTVARTIAARKDTIDAGIANAGKVFDDGAKAMVKVGPAIERIDRSAEAIRQMANNASTAATNAGKTADAVGADVRRLTAETLPEFERLLGEMNDLTASLRRMSETYEQNPGGLLFGRTPTPKGPGE